MPLVRSVHEHPGQELERVGGLGARRGSVGLVGAIRHRLRGPVVRQPLQRDGIPGAVAREARRERAIVLGDPKGSSQTAVCTWNPECGQVSMPAASSSSNNEELAAGRIFPELKRIREVSHAIAMQVAAFAFSYGLARCDAPEDLAEAIADAMYVPSYDRMT